MSSRDKEELVIEIGVEEIPSRYVREISEAFADGLYQLMLSNRLNPDEVKFWYTPRRLIVGSRIGVKQSPQEDTVRGPQVGQAWKNGEPTPALHGFLKRVGIQENALGQQTLGDKQYVVAVVQKPEAKATALLPSLVDQALRRVPLPRSMRWDDSDVRFIRPIRWVVILFADNWVPGEVMGVPAGHVTFGNRTDAPGPIDVSSPADYWLALGRGLVEPDAERRRQIIVSQGQELAESQGGRFETSPQLLDEVVNLVEWPTPFLGEFAPQFLEVPDPILTTAMRVHQRYFPVRSADEKLMPYFVAVRNGRGQALDQVRHGNEKVLRARLSDARYFYERDRRQPLSAHIGELKSVLVHQKLGSYWDKVERVRALYEATASWWPLDSHEKAQFLRSVQLYKCDLLTQVVGEFPELQGEMGGIYAALDGEDEAVVQAIAGQYHPMSAQDPLPMGRVAWLLGLFDRLDTLLAFYRAGISPTGSEDPFGLRRDALGIARIASETPIMGRHTVAELIVKAAQVFDTQGQADDIYQLIKSRLVSLLQDSWPMPLIEATLAVDFFWQHLPMRLAFLAEKLEGAEMLQQAFKRVARIVPPDLQGEPLDEAYEGVQQHLREACDRALDVPEDDLNGWWTFALAIIPVINRFFDEVLVMDPDPAIRRARLALLAHAKAALGRYYAWDRLA